MSGHEWRDRALCAGRPLSEAHPHVRGDQRVTAARRYCAGCPVVAECAADALTFRDTGIIRAGVWLPQYDDRTALKRARARLAVIAEGRPDPRTRS